MASNSFFDDGVARAIVTTTAAVVATCLVSSAVSAGECLGYEPAMVTVKGVVALKPAYGPPGFGEDPKHDAREDYLAIILDRPVCTKASSEPDTNNVAETGVRAMQLVFDGGEAFKQAKPWIGKRISVTGSLYHMFTGHHHTTVLLAVKEIEQAASLHVR